jgi:hypothetical protein
MAARLTTTHQEIRDWAKIHNARPIMFRESALPSTRVLALIFPYDQVPEEAIEIPWEFFFEFFEQHTLAFLYHSENEQYYRILTRDYLFSK